MTEHIPKFSWGKKKSEHEEASSPPIVSFVEIMSEALANELQEKDLLEFDQEQEALEASLREIDELESNDCSHDFELALKLSEEPDLSLDAQLALELQRQFDREQDYESQQDSSKIMLSTDRFEYTKLENELQNTNEGNESDEEKREAETAFKYSCKIQQFPPCGFIKNDDGEIITKHNKEIGQKRNCQKMMVFPEEFKCGDLLDSKLSSRIYNDLQMFSKAETKRSARLKDKQALATSDAALDAKTRLILLSWINNEVLDRVEGVIAIGKESTVLNGVCNAIQVGTSSDDTQERRFAIKVHKQTLNAFRNRGEYVKDDFRFKNPRSILKIWTEKEYMNLKRLERAGLPCPIPLQFKKHVLLMSLIQDECGNCAPKLKDYIWASEEEKFTIFEQVKDIMIKMFNECKLVHADLSEFNLLFTTGKIYVIDLAQSVDLSHPRSLIFLHRDIENILNFFSKNATEGLPTAHQLFKDITQIEFDHQKDLLAEIESFNEQNHFTNLAQFRKRAGDYDLILADKEAKIYDISDSDED